MKKILTAVVILALALSLAACDSADYKKAGKLYEAGSYKEAAEIYTQLGDYEDSAAKANDSNYLYAKSLFEAGEFEQSAAVYEALDTYKDAAEKAEEARTELMYVTYAAVFETLDGGVWFYEDTSVNAVNRLVFAKDSVKAGGIYYDGNGPHESTETDCTYTVDDKQITVTLPDEVLEIPYTQSGDTVTLDAAYFTPEQVDAGLQGYWGLRKVSFNQFTGFSTGEYIYYYENGKVTFESANTAYGKPAGTYYYYGPYEGTYKVTEKGMEMEARNDWQFGFTIKDGKVFPNRCGDDLSVYEGFKGKNGYSFK